MGPKLGDPLSKDEQALLRSITAKMKKARCEACSIMVPYEDREIIMYITFLDLKEWGEDDARLSVH